MLTNQQKAHFDVFGFLVVRQLFSPDEVDVITREFDAAMLEARGGKPFAGRERQSVKNWINGRPTVEFLTTDSHHPRAFWLRSASSVNRTPDQKLRRTYFTQLSTRSFVWARYG